MAITNANIGHQSPQSSLPPLSQKQVNTFTWGSGGNTAVVADPYFRTNSVPNFWITGTTPQSGQWSFAVVFGQCTITSSSSENSTLTVSYTIE